MYTKEDWKEKRKAELEATIPDGLYSIGDGSYVAMTGKSGYIQYLIAIEEEALKYTLITANMTTEMDDAGMYRDLNKTEVLEFKQWARENYEVGSPINSTWHPIVKAECEIMNSEDHREADDIIFNEEN